MKSKFSRILVVCVLVLLLLASMFVVLSNLHPAKLGASSQAEPLQATPQDPQAVVYCEPESGWPGCVPCNPLANDGFFAMVSGQQAITEWESGGGYQTVSKAAVYGPSGQEPMADAMSYAGAWGAEELKARAPWYFSPSYDDAEIDDWPYLIFNKTTGKPLDPSTYYFSIPVDLSYRMSLLVSGDANAEGDVSILFGPSVSRVEVVGPSWSPQLSGGSPAEGTVSFNYSGDGGQLYMTVSAGVTPIAGWIPSSWSNPSSPCVWIGNSEGEALVDPYLFIDPSSPLANELQVYVGNSANADPSNSSAWTPSVQTPVDLNNIVPLMLALAVPTVTPSPGTVDQGQTCTLTSSPVTTGTAPYTYQWFSEAPGASYYSSIGGADSSSYNFVTSTSTATGNWNFILQVKDNTTASVNSAPAVVTVLPVGTLAAPSVTPSPGTVDQGQTSTLTISPVTTGTAPYTYQWFSEAPGASYYSSIGGADSSSYNFVTSASTATGNWNYMLQVTDFTGALVNSTVAIVTVLPVGALTAPTVTSSPSMGVQGLISYLNSSAVTTGTPPYTYQWFSEAPGASYYSSIGGANSSSYWFMTSTSTATGSWGFILQVKDSTGATVNSTAATVLVNSAGARSISLSTPAINGLRVDFNGAASPGNRVTYIQWIWGDGSADNGWFPHSHTYASSGDYFITVTAYFNDGTSASTSTAVNVYVGELTGGDRLTITAGNGGSVAYAASVGSGTIMPGGSKTLYLAHADDLSLAADPSSGYHFNSWTASAGISLTPNSTSSNIFIVVVSDASILANFGANIDWWPMFHHDLNHTGYSTSTPPKTNKTLWTYTTDGGVYSSPAVAGGYVYVGSDRVYCLNATTGASVWNYTTGGGVNSSPAVVGGYVYVGSSDSKVYCLNATMGTLKWSYTTGGAVQSSPAVVGGYVYVGSDDHNVYCLNAKTGAYVWNYTTGWVVSSSPAVAGGVVYVGSGEWDHHVYALNATTGVQVWNYTTGYGVDSSPAVAGGYVYVGSDDDKVYCLNAKTGASVWNYTTGSFVMTSPAVAGGYVYVGSDDDKVYCLNATMGTLKWSYKTGYGVWSSPAVADGYVYVGSNDFKVYCLNAATGASVWNYTTGSSVWSCPAVANGVVYVGSEDDNVYAFGALAPVATPYLLLTAEPIQATYSGGQTVAFTVDVLNQLCPALASTLTLTVTGPNGYYYYDFQAVNVTANSVGEYGFTWTAPYVTGTYVVEVSLVPVQLTAYDAVWLNVGTS